MKSLTMFFSKKNTLKSSCNSFFEINSNIKISMHSLLAAALALKHIYYFPRIKLTEHVLCAAITSLLLMQLAGAEVQAGVDTEIINEYKVFDPALECSAHRDFLEGNDVFTSNNCHGIATFQIENQHLGDIQFLKKMSSLTDDGTSLGALVTAVQSSIFGDPATIYSTTELASRRVMISLGQSGDVERAVFYAQLLSEIKHSSLSYFCREDIDCRNMGISLKTGKAFGASLSYIDDFPPQATLMCLLRVDSYLSPLRKILLSHKFNSCLKARKYFEGADQ